MALFALPMLWFMISIATYHGTAGMKSERIEFRRADGACLSIFGRLIRGLVGLLLGPLSGLWALRDSKRVTLADALFETIVIKSPSVRR
jgi:uncharacterized RDD family membrane protein YckC